MRGPFGIDAGAQLGKLFSASGGNRHRDRPQIETFGNGPTGVIR
jgi:hypothetical protein